MGYRLGLDAKLYYKVGGVASANPWLELSTVREVTLTLETGEADVTTRGTGGWRATAATLREGTLEFELLWDPSDAGFSAIRDAYFGNLKIGLAAMDGGIVVPGSQGLQADFAILSFSRKEPLEEALMVSVSAKPTNSATAPQWVTVPPAGP